VSDLPRRAGLDYGEWASGGLVPPRRDDWLGPFRLDAIYQGDARQLAKYIPDESVDLIFTDPVYDRIDDYRWLAETAERVLRPDGALLVWSNGKWHKTNTDWLERAGLTYRYTFTTHMIRAVAPMNGKIISKCNRVIWLDKIGQSRLTDYVADGYPDRNDPALGNHHWAKSPRYTRYLLEGFEHLPLVFDPFAGEGTNPIVCHQMRRPYLAFEWDTAKCQTAKQRVTTAQISMVLLEPQQLALPEVAA